MRTALTALALVLFACPPLVDSERLRYRVDSSVSACVADDKCRGSLEQVTPILQSCPWYTAVGCSAAVAAAVTCCAATEGELCLECVELVAKIGCCDCLPKGKVRDSCKQI